MPPENYELEVQTNHRSRDTRSTPPEELLDSEAMPWTTLEASSRRYEEDDDPDPHYDAALDRRTVRKFDWILLPFLSVLFLLNSLDRSNIGNAETAHFTRDTGLQPGDLNVAVACFFVFFVALQPVGAAAGRKFGMGRWVPGVMTLWGICTALHVWVRAKWQLILLRIVIGILEAGFYPTTVSYLSLFYTRYEFARRLGLFYGQYAVAGAIGGLLAFGVLSAFPPDSSTGEHNSNGWKSWQVLFLVEGGLTVAVAVIGLIWLPRSAGTAWFLQPEERQWAEERIRRDRDTTDPNPPPKPAQDSSVDPDNPEDQINRTSSHEEQTEHLLGAEQQFPGLTRQNTQSMTSDTGLTKSDILSAALSLPLLLSILIINITSAIPSMAFSVFLPLVLSSLNLSSSLHSNLLTAPPFLLAAVTLYSFTYWSDISHKRILPILVGLAITIFGLVFTVLLPTTTPLLIRYIALIILLSGSFIASPLTVAWLAGNMPEPGKRAIVLGINGWGNLAGVFSALLFSPRFKESGYKVPFWITLICVGVAFVGYGGFRMWLMRVNRWRGAIVRDWRDEEMERERKWGIGSSGRGERNGEVEGAWGRWIRRWVGGGLLRMNREAREARRGDERMTFVYGL